MVLMGLNIGDRSALEDLQPALVKRRLKYGLHFGAALGADPL